MEILGENIGWPGTYYVAHKMKEEFALDLYNTW